MSTFFAEDICALKADPAIVGTVVRTWSDIDSSSEGLLDCYIHKDLPVKVQTAWFDDEKLSPGFVILAFSRDYDGHCLIAESSLLLIDRSLTAGDVVKKRLSDTQSGVVINTSLTCSLQPLCSQSYFMRQRHPQIHGHTPSHGPNAPKRATRKATIPGPKLAHGFPSLSSSEREALDPLDKEKPPLLQVPASELKYWSPHREEDTVIYQGWIGEVRSVYGDVTIRLSNGSVVTVDAPDELEEPYWVADSPSYELVQRLDRAGYYQHRSKKGAAVIAKPQWTPAEPCYPGQYVQTKKGNLRRGTWKFGAYDPEITPSGIVVDVRNIQLEVRWLSQIGPPENLNEVRWPWSTGWQEAPQGPPVPPDSLLDIDDLENGEIIIYDRSKIPNKPAADTLANPSYGPDTGFGHRVRFRDPFHAATKYGPTSKGATHSKPAPSFDRIPRAATQGFDMNVLEVVKTTTKAVIRWQDCSITEEDSTQLFPYLNPDDNDVWPGEKVSHLPDEEKLGDGVPIVRLHKVGVVQSVDARERIARVRWFEGTEIDVDEEEKAWQYSASKYGNLLPEVAVVPLYDIAAHGALAMDRGSLVIVAPAEALSPVPNSRGGGLRPSFPPDRIGDVDMPDADAGLLPQSRFAPPSSTRPGLLTTPFQSVQLFLGLASGGHDSIPQDTTASQPTERIGEVAELCLDGEIVVRLGAASEVREAKVSPERITVIAPAITGDSVYSDGTDDDEESYFNDAMSMSNEETSLDTDQESGGAIDVSVEYEGGEKLDNNDDDEMWATDEEDVGAFDESKPSEDGQKAQHLDSIDVEAARCDGALDIKRPQAGSKADSLPPLSSYPLMPHRFCVIEDQAPSDHHFVGMSRPLTSDLMRRVMKEHKIMQSSLPDGIFVRTWECRLDLLRVLIVGPSDTPYEFAPFVVDLHFNASFPTSPPDAFFHSWTGGLGRINPNLYEDGKICLSLLGTWDADERNEEWSPKRSTVLQILVSLMGLVLVKEPYYNEAGFDVLIGSAESQVPSALYSERVYVMSKIFIKTALTSTPLGLADVVRWLYLSSQSGPNLLRRVLDDSTKLLADTNSTCTSESPSREMNEEGLTRAKLSTGASILLRRNVELLEGFIRSNDE